MRILDYFYENYLRTFVEFCEELGESAINLFLTFISWFLSVVSWFLGVGLFITIPLWIIPYKLWKRKGDG